MLPVNSQIPLMQSFRQKYKLRFIVSRDVSNYLEVMEKVKVSFQFTFINPGTFSQFTFTCLNEIVEDTGIGADYCFDDVVKHRVSYLEFIKLVMINLYMNP